MQRYTQGSIGMRQAKDGEWVDYHDVYALIVDAQLAEDELQRIKSKLECFRSMLDEWREGRHVTKICYGLNNEHMKVLDDLLDN